jgi:hypothetical protein
LPLDHRGAIENGDHNAASPELAFLHRVTPDEDTEHDQEDRRRGDAKRQRKRSGNRRHRGVASRRM